MGHLVVHVLPEPELGRVEADPRQVALDPSHEVPQRLVVDDPVRDGLADGRPRRRLPVHLSARRVHRELGVFDALKFGVGLIARVAEVLYFGHREFPATFQALIIHKIKFYCFFSEM